MPNAVRPSAPSKRREDAKLRGSAEKQGTRVGKQRTEVSQCANTHENY